MAEQSLATKYRPRTLEDVTEQDVIKSILKYQLDNKVIKNCYLFVGPAGCGKTTSARIFADEINNHKGNPIELDAASNNSVDDMRNIIKQSQTQSLDSEYKIFIIDEAHMITPQGWNALLKLLEEPPAKSIFIFATTDPQKIPKTILSRVQRYDFTRISQQGIVDRLKHICDLETKDIMEEMGDQDSASDIEWAREQKLPIIEYDIDALSYLAKLSEGGMRDAITLMDKCLAYSKDLTVENVIKALGATNYNFLFNLNDAVFDRNIGDVLKIVDDIHASGQDLKKFVSTYVGFLLDICKYHILKSFDYLTLPNTYANILNEYNESEYSMCRDLLDYMLKLNSSLKYENKPKEVVEATLLLYIAEGGK